jgi:hypothetical protein
VQGTGITTVSLHFSYFSGVWPHTPEMVQYKEENGKTKRRITPQKRRSGKEKSSTYRRLLKWTFYILITKSGQEYNGI